ncbi:hypothetical protein HK098_003707 [Nowakowskiella sp. JEL0407]|nr:hypothetical protein HK098_003707 [Nowakowskiella sp. JEL0407]
MRRPVNSIHDEHNTTLDYMSRFGIENVRGGSWCLTNFTPGQIRALEEQIRHLLNLCVRCGLPGHLAAACPSQCDRGERYDNGNVCCNCGMSGHWANVCDYRDDDEENDYGGTNDEYEHSYDEDDLSDYYKNELSHNVCFRCGRIGHWQNNCYARTFVDGTPI